MIKRHISVLLLTHNEEKNLLKYWTWLDKAKRINEIVVIDDNSDDKTVEILKKLESKKIKVKIYVRGLNNNFSDQRNFGITKTTNNWIFWLDADEKPSTGLIRFLNHIGNLQYKNYAFKRNDVFINHKKFVESIKNYYSNGGKVWNDGLTKNNDDRLKSIGEKNKLNFG